MFNRIAATLLAATLSLACTSSGDGAAVASATDSAASANTPAGGDSATTLPPGTFVLTAEDSARIPNELGRIPVVEYHLIDTADGRYARERGRFARDLELIYKRGYRPISISQLLDRKIDLPKGLSPVVFVFDDASPSQFRYIERNGNLEIDPTSGVGIWMNFRKNRPDWANNGVFCMLSGAAAGRSFFGDRGIEGQKSEWRHKKVQYLNEQGFELCNHTLWHANLSKYPDAVVQEQIARGEMAIDSAVPGYNVRTFALPLGVWPKNRGLAKSGSWTDPKTGKTFRYDNEAILEVAGGPTESPHDPKFNPLSIKRIEVFGNQLENILDRLDRTATRYVSDGDPNTVARPPAQPPAQ
ncbi:MAG: polysaccharide deacetylase family protein [Gemmatimonadaceae bacterium]